MVHSASHCLIDDTMRRSRATVTRKEGKRERGKEGHMGKRRHVTCDVYFGMEVIGLSEGAKPTRDRSGTNSIAEQDKG